MRLLLGTHTLLWGLAENSSLPASARRLIANENSDVLVSAASAWKIAPKVRLGKLSIAIDLAHDFSACLEQERFETLAVNAEHGIRAGLLPRRCTKDPFDRTLIAQALAEDLAIVSNHVVFDGYGSNGSARTQGPLQTAICPLKVLRQCDPESISL
jgi:PIN domain nuclease of toxin-antitoxin system